jgi:hypothetical protein
MLDGPLSLIFFQFLGSASLVSLQQIISTGIAS